MSMFVSPISIRMRNARLIIDYNHPSHILRRERGGFQMKSEPLSAEIDNRAFFDSLGLKSIDTLSCEMIGRSQKAVSKSVAESCKAGDMLAAPDSGGVAEVARMKLAKRIETAMAFIPDQPEIHWKGGEITLDYTPDKLRFEWKIQKVKLAYEPYSIEFNGSGK